MSVSMNISTDLEPDSDKDIDFHEFCAICFWGEENVSAKRYIGCMLSYYCSIKCQLESWNDNNLRLRGP